MDGPPNIYRQPGTSPERDKLIKDVYYNLRKAYEGFYVGNFSGEYLYDSFIFGGCFNVRLPSRQPGVGALFALKKHNEDEGTNLQLTKLLRANVSGGRLYYLTFKASDNCYYEAKVFCGRSKWELMLFRPARHYHTWSSGKKVDFSRIGISKSMAKSLSKPKLSPKSMFNEFKFPAPPAPERVIFNDLSTDLEIIASATDKGFHKGATGTCSVCRSSYRVRDAARLALEEHNKNEGTDLKLKMIIRANMIGPVKPHSRSAKLKRREEDLLPPKPSCGGFFDCKYHKLYGKKYTSYSSRDERFDMDATDDEETQSIERCARLIVEEHNKNEGTDLELESEM